MRPRLGLFLVLPLLLAGWLAGTGTASAHDELVGSNPSAGSVLAKGPSSILLTFSDTVHATGTAIKVTDASGTDLQTGTPAIDGSVVSQSLKVTTVPGPVHVVWRVTSADGHPATGDFDFSIKGTATSTTLQRTSTSTDTDAGTSWGTSVPNFQHPTDKTNNKPVLLVGVVLLAVVVIGGLTALIRLRARGDDADL